MKAVIEVTWILAALPGAELVGNHLHLRDGSRIPITTLELVDGAWHADGGWTEQIHGV